jgi:hypothetical protein
VDAEWFITRGTNEKLGPFTAPQVLELLAQGKITSQDWAWRQGEQKWVALKEVVPLMQQQAAPPERALPSSPRKRKHASGLQLLGAVLLGLGIVVTLSFAWRDTTVSAGAGERVHNLGLIADRLVGVMVGIGLSIIGAMFIASNHDR